MDGGGVPTLHGEGGIYLKGIPTLDGGRGYLAWMGRGGGTYLKGIPTLDGGRGYLAWMGRGGGTYLGQVTSRRYASCSFPQEGFLVKNIFHCKCLSGCSQVLVMYFNRETPLSDG